MRISTKIVSSGECWHPHFPLIDVGACYQKCTDGATAFDEDEFRRQVRDQPEIQMSSRDYGTVCAFSAVMIALRAALKPVLGAMTAEIGPGRFDYCATIIEKAQRIYNGSGESEVKK